MIRPLFLIVFTIFILTVLSQTTITDSIENQIQQYSVGDTVTVNMLNEAAYKIRKYDVDKLFKYAKEAEHISDSLNFERGKAESVRMIGIGYYEMYDYSKAIQYFQESLQLFRKLKNKEGIAVVYKDIGNVHYYKSNFNEALKFYQNSLGLNKELENKDETAYSLYCIGWAYKGLLDYNKLSEYFQKALTIKEELGDTNEIAIYLNKMGRVFESIGDYDKALKYHKKSLELNKKINNKKGIGYSFNNIGLVYKDISDNERALEYFQKSIKIKSEINDQSGIASTYNYIGMTLQEEGDYEEALNYFSKALTIKKESDNKLGVAESYKNLGFVYKKLKNYSKAEKYFHKSNIICISLLLNDIQAENYLGLGELYYELKKYTESLKYAEKSYKIATKLGNISLISRNAEILAKNCEALGLYQKGYDYFVIFKTMNDSLYNKETIEKITRLEHQLTYQKEKQELEIKQQKEDAINIKKEKQQKVIHNFLIAGSFLMLILGLAIMRSFWRKQKANKSLIKQNNKINELKNIIENKTIHITDSINYAQHIQQSIFLSNTEIKKFFKDSFLISSPKDIVSGDFFWHTEINNKKIFSVVDCTGHGVPGAFMSIIGNSLLNEIVKEKGITEPSEILYNMHTGVLRVLKQGSAHDGMDMAICVYDIKSKELQFAGARNSLYLHNGDKLKIIEGDPFSVGEILLGKNYNVKFCTKTLHVKPNSNIYLTTDGYMDQFGGLNNKKINQIPFEKILSEINKLPMDNQKEKLMEYFKEWKGLNKQVDDVMILGVVLN